MVATSEYDLRSSRYWKSLLEESLHKDEVFVFYTHTHLFSFFSWIFTKLGVLSSY